ncbi:MAG: hypothetical protein GX568_01520 [Candidatus Gastranaerophilales bacterium]|nr:hypothetical protein [Candidatus Gastranaerophilales bacterium]
MSVTNTNCFLCENNLAKSIPTTGDFKHISCNVCGDIFVTGSYLACIERNPNLLKETEKIALSYYYKVHTLNNKKNSNNAEILTEYNIESIISSVNYPLSLLDKINIVLQHFHSNTQFFHQGVNINFKKDYRLFFCRSENELNEIIQYLLGKKYIRYVDSNIQGEDFYCLLTEGIQKIEELKKETKSDQCFVAMWFSDETDKAYSESIEKAIEEDSGYECYKVSNNDQNNGWIPDTIVKEIRRSKFVIADLTGYRAGVYYEAGFAEGLGKEVIYTCNKNWFDEQEEMMKIPIQCSNCSGTNELKLDGVHFNLKQRKMILWEEDNLPDFRKALAERIGAVIGINEKKKT